MGNPASASAEPRASLTLDVGYLVLPVLKGAVEGAITPRTSVRVSGGYGRINSEQYTDGPRYYEAGLQGRYYLLGHFRHGLALGGEARYGRAKDDVSSNVAADGAAIGPIVAYKYISRLGFTVDLSGGIGVLVVRGGGDAKENDQAIVPLLNLNLGWSF